MPRATRLLPLLALFLVPLACADDGAGPTELLAPDAAAVRMASSEGLTVMSQNLYLGAALEILLGPDPGTGVFTALSQLQTSNAAAPLGPVDAACAPQLGLAPYGPARLREVALDIAHREPHLVGLQEVTTYTFTPGPPFPVDYLQVLHGWLAYFACTGETTHTWSSVRNSLAEVPLDLTSVVGIAVNYRDADAILMRDDVTMIGGPELVTYQAYEEFSVFGAPFDNVRGYLAVTVEAAGHELVFVNTHLEVQQFPETQRAQTAELIAAFEDEERPVVMVGDFNSAANPHPEEDQVSDSYRMLRNAGFADLWLREAHSVGGLTCCQAADLTNPESVLHSRLDLVLARYGPAGFGGRSAMEVVGEEAGDRVGFFPLNPISFEPLGPEQLVLWPSDHAGVVATLWPAPGILAKAAR